jgi:hypothetical protein
MGDKEYKEFAKQQLEGRREVLRTVQYFSCACCDKQKTKEEAAGAHLYKTEDAMLNRAMKLPDGRMRVGTYVLCLECVDSVSDEKIQANVTKNMAKEGLFGSPV